MTKTAKLALVPEDESVLWNERSVFFGRLSDITVLPDWFQEDEEKYKERYMTRWQFVLKPPAPPGTQISMFNMHEYGLGLRSSNHLKVLYSTHNKESIYVEPQIKILMARLTAGLGKLILCDGYPKEALDSFGHNIARVLQLKMTNTDKTEEGDYRFTVWTGKLDNFVGFSKCLVATNDAQQYNDIENTRVFTREACKVHKWRFVDMTRKDWMKVYFPDLAEFFDKQSLIKASAEPVSQYIPDDPDGYGRGSGGIIQ